MIKLGKAQFGLLGFVLLVSLTSSAQRATLGIDVGQTSDKFGGQSRTTSAVGDITTKLVILQGDQKEGGAQVVAGAEARFPFDTNNHATEFAIFGGVEFRPASAFSVGVHVQVRKILMPSVNESQLVFNRNNMELMELPLFVQYRFGPSKHAFLQAEGAPEFRPRWRAPKSGASVLPNPGFDHAYFVRGSIGYNFGKWYAKGTYQTRYFKFNNDIGNPDGLYNWRSDLATAGVGLVF